ncbi:E3 ubiquitin-protein ligase RSL1-like [Primulina eburnea]|uniref:E3 ubiquitin-protein ligase RSL1-like n=1 Tax=Primulina eburnea TaxID=1245227 RepID=UPI003C6C4BC1
MKEKQQHIYEKGNTADTMAEDDEIPVQHATLNPHQKGKSKIDAIPVGDDRRVMDIYSQDYSFPVEDDRWVVDSSLDYSYYYAINVDDEVKMTDSLPKTRKVYEGQTSKRVKSIVFSLTMCEICADEKFTSDMFRVLGCDHSLCCVCAAKYVASKLQDNITGIKCPFTGCKGFLEPEHCHSILPKQVFDRWVDALCEAVVLESEKFYCPFKDCSALLVDERHGPKEVIMESECPHCNRLFCAECKVPWHSGATCAEFQKLTTDERSHEDIMLVNLAKKKQWKRCPKCRFYVDKRDGCSIIRCRCRYSFCYTCGARVRGGLGEFCRRCFSYRT